MNKITKKIKKKNTGARRNRMLLILLSAVLITGILAGGLLAKYRSENQKQAEMISSQFHVSSDYLAENNPSYEITDWKAGFDIQLYNYEKENTALISDDEITYKVDLSEGLKDKEEKTLQQDKWTYSDTHNGKIAKSSEKQAQSIKIRPAPQSAVMENDSVTVTVTITSPFTKTLSATFTMKGKSQPDYTIKDQNDGSILVTIQSNSYDGDITVEWSADKYAPDNTNPLMANWTNPSQTLPVQKNTTYELLFFKKSVETITGNSGSGTTISLS